MRAWQTRSEAETREVGRQLARELQPNGIVCLHGELGAGKTTLTQGLAVGLGLDAADVQSPSYTIVREHEGAGGRLVHIDLYRLDPGQVEALGMEEILAAAGVKAIEWPERLPFALPDALHLSLRRLERGGREIRETTATGERAEL